MSPFFPLPSHFSPPSFFAMAQESGERLSSSSVFGRIFNILVLNTAFGEANNAGGILLTGLGPRVFPVTWVGVW